MKTIHKRLYTVLPRSAVSSSSPPASCSPISRVRSNSASRSLYTVNASHPLSFFDAPPQPPPTSRPSNPNLVVSRLAAEAKAEIETNSLYSNHSGQNAPSSQNQSTGPPPSSLALTFGQFESSNSPSFSQSPFFLYQSFSTPFGYTSTSADPATSDHPSKRQRTRYQLDVGAYGIPKRSCGACVAGRDGQGKMGFVGGIRSRNDQPEDLARAVQVGEDAYFVHDNAMGVADGVGGWSKLRRTANALEPSPSALFARRLMHYCSEEVEAAAPAFGSDVESDVATMSEEDDLCAELEDSLEELEDGLDVLMILERAFEKTLQSHVRHRSDDTPACSLPPCGPGDGGTLPTLASPALQHNSSASPPPASASTVPILQGSSTALLAVLEHPSGPNKPRRQSSLFSPQPRFTKSPSIEADRGAVLRIAHLGDCVGMLIRGDEVIWRTEEMWWNFNTPVQLGPSSPTRARDAQVFAVPVQADDILVLASDGLSDNLWDEEILDEVVRFRRTFMLEHAPPPPRMRDASPVRAFRRTTLAGMLSEALCSRARRVSEVRGGKAEEREVPFGRRAREHGKAFRGGKPDDISVLVAVISPVE